jgi:hypothetical protein
MAGYVGGYMTQVPKEWQGALGSTHMTGQAGIPIISRTSVVPAVFGFDPHRLGETRSPATPLVYYPLNNSPANVESQNSYFNTTTEDCGAVHGRTTTARGASNRIGVSGVFSFVGNELRYSGATIGTRNAEGGIGWTDLRITFNQRATPAVVQQLVRSLNLRTFGDSATLHTRTLEFSSLFPMEREAEAIGPRSWCV